MFKQIKRKYSSISIQEKAIIWNTICNIIIRGIQFLMVPIYIRMMSQSEYGIYSTSFSWIEIIMIFTSMNMFSTTYSVALTKWENKKDEVTSCAVTLSILWSLLLMLVLCTKWDNLESLMKISKSGLACFGIYLLFEPIKLFWCTKQKYLNRYKVLIAVTFVDVILNLLIGILFLLQFEDKIIAAIAAKTVTEGIIGFILLCSMYSKSRVLYKWEYWSYMIFANIPLLPYYLALRVLQHLDRIMIQYYVNSAETAIYGFAYNITNSMMILNTSINGTFTPWLFISFKKGIRDIKNVYQVLLVGIASANLLLIMFAPEVVNLLGTDQYEKAMYMIPPLALSSIVIFIYDQFVSIELYFEKSKGGMFIALVCVLINGILNYCLIPRYGAVAAGYTTLISYIAFAILHYCYYRYVVLAEKIEISIFGFRELIYICFISIIISILLLSCYNYLFLRISFAILICIVLCIAKKRIVSKIHIFRNLLGK